jgi:hypothetical protein
MSRELLHCAVCGSESRAPSGWHRLTFAPLDPLADTAPMHLILCPDCVSAIWQLQIDSCLDELVEAGKGTAP